MSSAPQACFVTGLILKHGVKHEMSCGVDPLLSIDAAHPQRLPQQGPEEAVERAGESRNIDIRARAWKSLEEEEHAADATCCPSVDLRFLARKIGV